jgi:hypothetical protein
MLSMSGPMCERDPDITVETDGRRGSLGIINYFAVPLGLHESAQADRLESLSGLGVGTGLASFHILSFTTPGFDRLVVPGPAAVPRPHCH